ncbi:MAG: hypothetical protein WDA60_04775 [Acidimicrobiia bacterium]|jgi:hypothetical protein
MRLRSISSIAIVAAVLTGSTAASASLPAKSAKPDVTLSGAVAGKSRGGLLSCTESTQTKGLQLGLTLGSFTVGGANYSLSAVLAGPSYAAGTSELGPVTGPGVFMQLAADRGGQRWASTAGSGKITLAKDKKSSTFEGDLASATGGPSVHVKGTFKCTKVLDFGTTRGSTVTAPNSAKPLIAYNGTSKLLSATTDCHSTTLFTFTIVDGAKYAGKTAVVMFYGLDYPTHPTKDFTVGANGSFDVTFEAFSCSQGGVGEQQGVGIVSVDGNANITPPIDVLLKA